MKVVSSWFPSKGLLWPVICCLFLVGAFLAWPIQSQPSQIIDLLTVDPADGDLRRIFGSYGQGNSGVPVSGGADCDGDGFEDYAVGFMRADPFSRFRAGEVDLIFGDGTLAGTVDTDAADARILRLVGAQSNENAGSEIWIDDVTGDGLGDLLIARQNYDPGSRCRAGALTILVGGPELRTEAANLALVDLGAPPSSLKFTHFYGAQAGDRLGIWMRTGDITGDGIADIVVGADQEDVAGTNSGALYVIRGGAHLASSDPMQPEIEIDLANFGSTAIAGHLAKIVPPANSGNFHFGATCQLGDLDGNGRAEVIAAATLNRAGAVLTSSCSGPSAQGSGGAPDGRLYIAWDDNFPAGPWPVGYTFVADAAPGSETVIRGEPANVSFGEELLAGADYNNDGSLDLFVGDLTGDGTPLSNRTFSGIGYVIYSAETLKNRDFNIQSPPAGTRVTRILGPSNGAIGGDTAAFGDFDGDSVDDLAYTSPHANPAGRSEAGVVHVLFGQNAGWPDLIDTAPGAFPPSSEVRIAEIQGAFGDMPGDKGDTLAYSADAADLNDDGLDDLITNEMVGNGIGPGTVDVGNLILVSGAIFETPSIFVDGFDRGDLTDWSSVEGKFQVKPARKPSWRPFDPGADPGAGRELEEPSTTREE